MVFSTKKYNSWYNYLILILENKEIGILDYVLDKKEISLTCDLLFD